MLCSWGMPNTAGTIARLLVRLYRWGPKLLEQGLGGSRALQKDTALAVAQAHCTAAEKVGAAALAGRCRIAKGT